MQIVYAEIIKFVLFYYYYYCDMQAFLKLALSARIKDSLFSVNLLNTKFSHINVISS